MKDLLQKILYAYGATGLESPVAEVIRNEVAPFVDEVTTDALGNLICIKHGTSPAARRVMFSAHMDHIGLVVTGFEKEGFLRVTNVGGINLMNSIKQPVVFNNGVRGVMVLQPCKDSERRLSSFYIDIGAEDEAEARSMVSLGDVAVYAPNLIPLGKHRFASPAMDNRSCCALLAKLLQTMGETKDTIIAVFSVQEEVGCRGAKVASFAYEPDIAIALDVTLTGDTPETKEPAIHLGDGVAIKFMDRASISHPVLRDSLLKLAEDIGVKTQREILPYGGTDAGAMQTSRGGIPVCTVSIPCRNMHSTCETIDMRDMEAALRLLQAFVRA